MMGEFLKGRKIWLASRSPRRKELLSFITEDFSVKVSRFDEGPLMESAGSITPEELVKALSAGKARAVLEELGCPENSLVIGGDTVVVSPEGEIFGIPKDRQDAARMLRLLAGREHRVTTGVTLSNCVGVVDSDYRGELQVAMTNHSKTPYTIHPGDRIAQLVVSPVFLPEVAEVSELDETERGAGGFGSTGFGEKGGNGR